VPRHPDLEPVDLEGITMVSEQVFKGHWTEIRGRVKERWGQLTDDDLVMAEGNLEQLAGIIERRTGENRDAITRELDDMTSEFGSAMERIRQQAGAAAATVSQSARQYTEDARQVAGQAAERIRSQYDHMHEQYDHARSEMQARYSDAQALVRRSPIESLTVAFGAGLMAGIVLGLSLRPRD